MSLVGEFLGLCVPLLQAGMGGVAGPSLAAAVSNSGAGGTVALYRSSAEASEELVRQTSSLTSRPFGVNVIPEVVGADLLMAQFEAVTEVLPSNGFVTTFGLPTKEAAAHVVDRGYPLIIQIGDPRAAIEASKMDADVVVLQGIEAGGHLLGSSPMRNLLHEGVANQPFPLVMVAGGIGSKREFDLAIEGGAAGVMCGTVFVPTVESEAHEYYKRAIVRADATDTVITGAFDFGWRDRKHRVLKNRITRAQERLPQTPIATITSRGRRYPIFRYSANVPTKDTIGNVEEMALYCGMSCRHVSVVRTAAEVVRGLTGHTCDPSSHCREVAIDV